jgi:tetratricopeptide (TPR) repeat protein
MKRLIPIILILLVIGISPVVSLAGELEDAKEDVRKYPNDSAAHYNLGIAYRKSGRYKEAIASYKESIRLNPDGSVPLAPPKLPD